MSNAEPDVLNAENSIVVGLWQLKALLAWTSTSISTAPSAVGL